MILIIIFSLIIFYIAVLGLWPFNKIIGFFSIASIWKKTKEINNDIQSAIRKLPASNFRNEFTSKYHDIDQTLSAEGHIFNHLWKEFKEQLVEPNSNSKNPVFQNSIRPEKFFTLEHLLKQKNFNSNLLSSMSGILVGLGVLGTFLGLSISLWNAFPYLNGQNENIEEAIRILMSGTRFAFLTSVAGISFSLLFNFISDKRLSMLQNSLNTFNSNLEKSLKFITEEHLLTDCLKELIQNGKYLSEMSERIALKVGDHIDQMGDKIQEAIGQKNQNLSEQLLSDIANQMTQGMGDFSKKQIRNLKITLDALQENIPPLLSKLEQSQKESEEQSRSLMNHLATISKNNQNQINQSLIETTQNIKSEFEEMIQNMKQSVGKTLSHSSEELKALITSLTEMNQKILKQTDESKVIHQSQLEDTANRLLSFTDRLDKAISEVNQMTNTNIKEALYNLQKITEQQKHFSEENKNYILSLNDLANSLKPMPNSISEITKQTPLLMKQINDSNQQLQKIWNQYETRFKDVDKSAERIFIEIKGGLDSVAKESSEYIANLSKQTNQISNSFAQAVEDLKEGIEDFNSNRKVS